MLDPDTNGEEFHLAFMCRSRVHRSVAMLRIASGFLKDLGYTVTYTKFHCTDVYFVMKQVIRRDAIATFVVIYSRQPMASKHEDSLCYVVNG